LAQTRKGKKTPGKEKKTPSKDFKKKRVASFTTKCDKIMRESVGKYRIQKCVSMCRDKMRQKNA